MDIDARAATVFRWLCQLKIAPYSYDWIDNLGRKSPTELTEGAEQLEIGQTFMMMFRLVDFEPGRSITLETRDSKWVGKVVVTYQTLPQTSQRGDGLIEGTRLIARLRCTYPNHLLGILMRAALPFGDWVMMRKQFLTFKKLAEREPTSSR